MASPREELVTALRDADGDSLRDAWLFDQQDHESVYVRDDVSERITDVDVEQYIDNERYGYITRSTYESLHYTDYEYTVRGFDEFLQYRTFLSTGEDRIGLMASYDAEADIDFRPLTARLVEIAATATITVGDS